MLKRLNASGPFWNGMGSTAFGLNSLLLLLLVSQLCGVEAAGTFGISFTTAQLLYLVGLFGANHFQMTDYAEKYTFAAYARLKALSTAIALVGGCLAVWALGFTWEKALLTALLGVYMQLHSVAELYQSLMFQKGRLDLSGRSLFFRTLVSLCCFAVVIVLTKNVFAASGALVVSGVVALWFWSVRPSRPYRAQASQRYEHDAQALVRECVPMFFSLFLTNLIINIPKYAVEYFWSDEVQGIFNIIFMPAQVINLFASFIFKPILKNIADISAARDSRAMRKLLLWQGAVVGGLAVLCLACVYAAGTEALGFLYGVNLSAHRHALALVIVGGAAFAYSQLVYFILVIMRCQVQIAASTALVGVAGCALSMWLVKAYGVLGGAAAFAAIHLLLVAVFLWMFMVIWRKRHA